MKFAYFINGNEPVRDRIADELIAELKAQGCSISSPDDTINFVLNFTSFEHPDPVYRHGKNEFVVSFATLKQETEDLRQLCYNTLVKTMSNLALCIKPNGDGPPEIYCVTPEVGFYHFPYSAEAVRKSIWPIISSHYMIDNLVTVNLPDKYLQTPVTEQLRHFGGELDALGLLPSVFKLEDVLNDENRAHLYHIFKIKGLSYGNLSARENIPEMGKNTFWMTGRGVDKAHLKGVGQDILLVTGYNLDEEKVLISVPAEHNPTVRVSVDAIEHALIYEAFPEVGAIVHVHAWFKDEIPATRQNYCCGTLELAREVVDRIKTTSHPEKAVIGLKNHGLTITGASLEEIFQRIAGKLLKEVPMMP